MTARTIRTNDGGEYWGKESHFTEHGDYIEYKSPHITAKIYKRAIVKDITTHEPTNLGHVIAIITFILMLFGTVIAMGSVAPQTDETAPFTHQAYLQQLELEIDMLFNQEYIDPLTDYIETYRKDETRSAYVQQVLMEREARCATVEQRYQHKKQDKATLAKLESGYNYSCPQVVAQFATQVP
jgi:hypothetical protein